MDIQRKTILVSVIVAAALIIEENEEILDDNMEENYLYSQEWRFVVIPSMSNKEFRINFRLTKFQFEHLLRDLQADWNERYKFRNPDCDFRTVLLALIWQLATGESNRQVKHRFGLPGTSNWRYLSTVKSIIEQRAYRYINYPNDLRKTAAGFESIASIPNCVGAIDGSHIPMTPDFEQKKYFANRKGYHSVVLQGIVDSSMKFL